MEKVKNQIKELIDKTHDMKLLFTIYLLLEKRERKTKMENQTD